MSRRRRGGERSSMWQSFYSRFSFIQFWLEPGEPEPGEPEPVFIRSGSEPLSPKLWKWEFILLINIEFKSWVDGFTLQFISQLWDKGKISYFILFSVHWLYDSGISHFILVLVFLTSAGIRKSEPVTLILITWNKMNLSLILMLNSAEKIFSNNRIKTLNLRVNVLKTFS